MTIKHEVMAAIKAVRKHFDLSMDDETCDAWNTIRAELLAMDARLQAADEMLRDIAGCAWFEREAPATVELIRAHLRGAADE